VLAGFGFPGDAMIRNLLDDLGSPLFFFSADFSAPVKPSIIKLPDFFYPFHEPGKFFELRPLIVDMIERAIDFDRFFYAFHEILL
jgi:uncharacterized membrane protein